MAPRGAESTQGSCGNVPLSLKAVVSSGEELEIGGGCGILFPFWLTDDTWVRLGFLLLLFYFHRFFVVVVLWWLAIKHHHNSKLHGFHLPGGASVTKDIKLYCYRNIWRLTTQTYPNFQHWCSNSNNWMRLCVEWATMNCGCISAGIVVRLSPKPGLAQILLTPVFKQTKLPP